MALNGTPNPAGQHVTTNVKVLRRQLWKPFLSQPVRNNVATTSQQLLHRRNNCQNAASVKIKPTGVEIAAGVGTDAVAVVQHGGNDPKEVAPAWPQRKFIEVEDGVLCIAKVKLCPA